MRRREQGNPAATSTAHLAGLATALFLAALEALGQEKQMAPAGFSLPPSQTPVRRIIVSIPDRRLALLENGRVIKTYPVAVGAAPSPSPAGEFRIVHRLEQPTYYRPGLVTPPGKENPLGTRWLGLSQRGYGIHGTNDPGSIGRRTSHGCIRMRNRDVEELFELVRVGDVVELRAKRNREFAGIFSPEKPHQPSVLPVGRTLVAQARPHAIPARNSEERSR